MSGNLLRSIRSITMDKVHWKGFYEIQLRFDKPTTTTVVDWIIHYTNVKHYLIIMCTVRAGELQDYIPKMFGFVVFIFNNFVNSILIIPHYSFILYFFFGWFLNAIYFAVFRIFSRVSNRYCLLNERNTLHL